MIFFRKSIANIAALTVILFDSCRAILGLPFVVLFFAWSVASGAPQNPENYEKILGGLVDIQDGAFVEGSLRQGGIQPDYRIDLQAPALKAVLDRSVEIGKLPVSSWDKIGMVLEIIRNDVFKYTDYKNPYYRRLLKTYRLANEDIPLSEYASCGAGVCREHALVLHFALKAAGISNFHAYATVTQVIQYYQVTEDHAFVVVRQKGVDWVVDAYNPNFNGYRLKDLMSPSGIDRESPVAPVATPTKTLRFIRKINDYPTIFNPIRPLCSGVFSS